ncbi:hypothetical protein ACIBCR_15220 [Micromonospora echinospora]|uniref:hypothetical protein n=1 Tax=Micromonospora echinospora TaxID=1877 RepID=UPI00378AB723
MEPISVMLLAAVITKMVTTHREDVEYARKGVDSPRYKVKLAKLAAAQKAGKPGTIPARPGAAGYAKELWHDAWEALDAHRERKRQARLAGWEQDIESLRDWSKRSLNTREDGMPVDDMLDVADVRPRTADTDDKPAPKSRKPTEYQDENWDEQPTPVVHDDQHPYCTKPCGPNCGRYRWTCGGCGETEDNFISHFEAKQSREKHICKPKPAEQRADDRPRCNRPGCLGGHIIGHRQWPGDSTSSSTADQNCDRCGWLSSHTTGKTWDQQTADFHNRNRTTTGPDDTQPLATVIPLFPTSKEVTMANSEATGLPTAIAFADAAATAHENFATAGSEGYTNALEGFDVSGDALSSAREAQEASTIAAEKWRAHKGHLEKQLTGQEFYRSNPDAGNKQFLAGE